MSGRAFFRQRPLVAASLAYAAGVLCALPGAGLPLFIPFAGMAASLGALACLYPRAALRVLCAS
ncbi:MAG TPA: hypothetical protein VLA21_02505, partial [Candidatus Limnocylindria bacterium]|nr:hypothetical protein [Candidatus Limnocylindria bacterium]